jgi:polysaccharide biosynthesis protein PslH
MRAHVLYVTPMFGYPPVGGPRLRTYHTLRALARCANVTLWVTQQPDAADREAARAHLLTFCRDVIFPPPPRPPSRLRRLVRSALPPPLRTRLRALVPARQSAAGSQANTPSPDLEAIAAWIEQHQPDVIWLGFGGISYHLVPLKARTGKPLVLETECVWSRFILREVPFEADPERREALLAAGRAKEQEERAAASLVDMTTACSDVDADYFRSLADPERVMLVNNVIDVDAYAASEESPARLQQPALLFTGTLSHGTGNVDAAVWLLDEIMPRVWQRRADVHVYLVGRSPAAEILARRGSRVHVTGEVASIVPYLRGCTAAVVPLRWESGTRFKILEAFACRVPVISTTLGAEGLAVEHDGHLLLADTAEGFSAAVLTLVSEPAVGRRLVPHAFDLVRSEYDVRSARRQIEAVLSRLGMPVADHAVTA